MRRRIYRRRKEHDKPEEPGRKYFLVHFARSGNSPESVGTFVLGEQSEADVKHIVITCNKNGHLAKAAIKDKSVELEFKGKTQILKVGGSTN